MNWFRRKKDDHKHEWTTWSVKEQGQITRAHQPESVMGFFVRQQRKCVHCGLIETRLDKDFI